MNIKINFFALFAGIFFVQTTVAQRFRPRIDALGSYVFPQYENKVNAGAFSLEHKKIRPCVEVGLDMPVSERFFIGAGIRYHHYFTSIYANNVTPDIIGNKNIFTWERGFTAFTIPISYGFSTSIKDIQRIELRTGIAFGIINTGYSRDRLLMDRLWVNNPGDTLTLEQYSAANRNPTFFFSTLDFAATFYPFRKSPRLGITLQTAFELTQNNTVSYSALIENISKKQAFPYEIESRTRFRTISMGLRYQFGKKPDRKMRSRTECPSS